VKFLAKFEVLLQKKNAVHRYMLSKSIESHFSTLNSESEKIRCVFQRTSPSSIIENVVRKFLNNYFTPDSSQSVARKDNCLYFKLPHIGPFSIITQRSLKKSVTRFCNDLEIKLMVFTSFKIRSRFGAKDSIPAGLRSRIIYKFSLVCRL